MESQFAQTEGFEMCLFSSQRQASSMRGRACNHHPHELHTYKRDGSWWEKGKFGIGSGMWGRGVAVDGKPVLAGMHIFLALVTSYCRALLIIWGKMGPRSQLTRLHLLQRFQSFLAPPRTSLVSASGSRTRDILWSPLLTRRARTQNLTRSLSMLKLSSPLREFAILYFVPG